MSVWGNGPRAALIGAGVFFLSGAGMQIRAECFDKQRNGECGAATFMSVVAGAPPNPADQAPPADKTGGFDGERAYEQV